MDITSFKHNNSLTTNWFQKPTSSNILLNFFSNHDFQLKKNIIYNLVDRAILFSDIKFQNNNLNIIKKILHENNYTTKYIERCISEDSEKLNTKPLVIFIIKKKNILVQFRFHLIKNSFLKSKDAKI